MFKVNREKQPFLIGKHYMIMIIELQKKIKIHFHIDLLLLMIISKKGIINIILLFIEPKVLNIQEYMVIIHLKNSFYMINLKYIVRIIKLDLVLLNLLQLLFQDMEVIFLLIDLNIIWIILKILISILIKLIIYSIIW